MECPNCGTQNEDQAEYCASCNYYFEPRGDVEEYAEEYAEPVMIEKRTSGLAVAALVLGILSIALLCIIIGFIPGILGIIFGAIALGQIKKEPQVIQGRGLAIAGIITSIIGILFSILLIIGAVMMPFFINARSKASQEFLPAN